AQRKPRKEKFALSLHGLSSLQDFLRISDANARAFRYGKRAVVDAQRRIEPLAVGFHAFLVFLPGTDVRHAGGELQRIDKTESAGEMHGGGHVAHRCHARHADGTNEAAVVKQVRLNNVGDTIANVRLKTRVTGFL